MTIRYWNVAIRPALTLFCPFDQHPREKGEIFRSKNILPKGTKTDSKKNKIELVNYYLKITTLYMENAVFVDILVNRF